MTTPTPTTGPKPKSMEIEEDEQLTYAFIYEYLALRLHTLENQTRFSCVASKYGIISYDRLDVHGFTQETLLNISQHATQPWVWNICSNILLAPKIGLGHGPGRGHKKAPIHYRVHSRTTFQKAIDTELKRDEWKPYVVDMDIV